ncbi:MAG: MBL fold metallo-hydrolase [Desulfosarcinaceae bacterium]|nr:MBL fold metallo-hydrolase [Desulfosarcinaceae bacterium]
MASQSNPRQLARGIYLLGNRYFNLYLIQGARQSALVEVGVSAVVDAVIAQLEARGVAPDYLILTHPHTDHFTGLEGLLARYPAARLVAAAGARAFAAHPKAAPKMVAEDRFMRARLAEMGWQPGRPSVAAIQFPDAFQRVTAPTEIDLGGLTLRCLPVRGHSPGSLAVHVPERKMLMTSDALGFRYLNGEFCPLFFTGYRDYLADLDRLAALKPTLLGPAHQGPLESGAAAAAFAAARQAATSLYRRIINHPNGEDSLVDALYEEFYREAFTLYTEANIRGCMQLLVRRALEAHGDEP